MTFFFFGDDPSPSSCPSSYQLAGGEVAERGKNGAAVCVCMCVHV